MIKEIWQIALAIIVGLLIALWIMEPPKAHAHVSTPNTFKTWTNEVLNKDDLNANFAHLHSTLTGNLKDANVSTTAAIQHSKLAQPGLLPRARAMIGAVGAVCDGAAGTSCTVNGGVNVTSVQGTGSAGEYNVTINYTPSTTSSPILASSNSNSNYCTAAYINTFAPQIRVKCYNDAGVLTNSAVTFVAY